MNPPDTDPIDPTYPPTPEPSRDVDGDAFEAVAATPLVVRRDENAPAWPAVVVSAVVGVVMLLSAVKWGPGISPDSTFYVSSAKSILQGTGHSTFDGAGNVSPITSYAPLYSVMLAGLQKLGLPAMNAAITLSTIASAALVLLAGRLAWLGAGGAWLRRIGRPTIAAAAAAGFAALLTAVSPEVLWCMVYVLTDAPFAVLILAIILVLGQWITRGGWWRAAILVVLTAASYLLRYAGLFIVAYVFGILLITFAYQWRKSRKDSDAPPLPWKRTVAVVAIVLLVSGATVVGWSKRNAAVLANDEAGINIGREMSWHPPTKTHYHVLGRTTEAWVTAEGRLVADPAEPTTTALLMAGVLPMLVLALMTPRRRQGSPAVTEDAESTAEPSQSRGWIFVGLLLSFAGGYLVFLGTSITLFDHATFPDYRILLPTWVTLYVGVLALIARLPLLRGDEFGLRGLRDIPPGVWAVRLSRAVVLGGIGVVLANAMFGSASVVRTARDNGIGYNRRAIVESEILEDLESLPPGTKIYTNAADIIRFRLERPASYLPAAYDRSRYIDRIPDPALPAQVEKMDKDIGDGDGVIVFLHSASARWWMARERDIAEHRLMFPLIKHRGDGSIYVLRDTPLQKEWSEWAEQTKQAREDDTGGE